MCRLRNHCLQTSRLQLSTFHDGMERLEEDRMIIYWVYIAAGVVATVVMFFALQACDLHLAYFAMSFDP